MKIGTKLMRYGKQIRKFSKILLIAAAFILSSCVEFVQEVSVDESGSGSLRFAYGVDTEVYPQFEEAIPDEYLLENLFASISLRENVTQVDQEEYEADGQTWQAITLDIDNVAEMFAEEQRVGPILISIDEEEGTYYYQQTVDLGLTTVNIPGINLLDLSGGQYTVVLKTPNIIDTNGVHSKAGLSSWDITVKDLVEGGEGIFVGAEYRLEPYQGTFIPWDLYFPFIVYGFLGLGIAAILAVILVNTQGNKKKNQQIKFEIRK